MPQFNFCQTATRAPGICMACGTPVGPFIDLSLTFVKVPTALGVMDAEGVNYLCVGTVENPGCAVHIGTMTGKVVEAVAYEQLREHAGMLNQEIAELRGALSKKTVSVKDLIDNGVIGEREPAHV